MNGRDDAVLAHKKCVISFTNIFMRRLVASLTLESKVFILQDTHAGFYCNFHQIFQFFRHCNGRHVFHQYIKFILFYLVFICLLKLGFIYLELIYTEQIIMILGKCFILFPAFLFHFPLYVMADTILFWPIKSVLNYFKTYS